MVICGGGAIFRVVICVGGAIFRVVICVTGLGLEMHAHLKIIMEIVATNVVASQLPERQPTEMPTTHDKN